jgi:hypothetical protein
MANMTGSDRKRYTDRPFPDYRHLPGQTPHPTRDPEGHSYGLPELSLPDLNHENWRKSEDYLYGIDLFNEGYWWECHEVLEGLWHASGIGSDAGHVLQAVIQCAAAHLKASTDRPVGAMRLHDHSLRHARWTGTRQLGLDLEAMVRDTRSFITVEAAGPAQLVLDI